LRGPAKREIAYSKLCFLLFPILFAAVCCTIVVDGLCARSVNDTIRGDGADGLFRIRHPEGMERMAETVRRLLEESAGDIAFELGLNEIDTIIVYLARGDEDYEELHGAVLPEWSSAFSDPLAQVMGINAEAVLRAPRPVRTVIRHELSHLLLAQRVEGVRCPSWFMEGLAMMQSREWTFSDHWGLMNSVWKKNIPYLEDLEGPFPRKDSEASLAYRISYAAVEELLAERKGALVTLTAFTRDLGDFDRAFLLTFGESVDHYSARFHVMITGRYRTIGTFVQSMPYWSGAAVLFLIAYTVKRIKNRRRLRQWETDDTDAPRF